MKKMSAKEIEEYEIKGIKIKIEMAETELDRLVDTIVKYSFIEVCTGGAYFNKLFQGALRTGFEVKRPEGMSLKKFKQIKAEWFRGAMFGDGRDKLSIAKGNLKYAEDLVGWAKSSLNLMGEDKKKKMIIDGIRQQAAWARQSGKNFGLFDKLKPLKKKAKKSVKPKRKV